MLAKRYHFFLLCVFSALAIGISLKPLADPDLGWHLAGGLWMLENWAWPQNDPFSVDGNFWVNYSWVAQVVFAAIFTMGGFSALLFLQSALIVFFVLFSYLLIYCLGNCCDSRNEAEKGFATSLAVFSIIIFTSPVWELRPQLLSIIFFTTLLWLLETGRDKLSHLFLLTVLWVNVHVYWCFVPLFVLVYDLASSASLFGSTEIRKRFLALDQKQAVLKALLRLFILLAAGLCSPYGWRNYQVLYDYLFNHSVAEQLIAEFEGLSSGQGYFIFAFTAMVLYLLSKSLTLVRQNTPLILVTVLMAYLAVDKIKFVPLFGVVSSFVLYYSLIGSGDRQKAAENETANVSILAMVCFLFSLLALLILPMREELLSVRAAATLDAARVLSERQNLLVKSTVNVMNDFDDGGWLALGFFLSKPLDRKDGWFKVCFDGRTLVLGEDNIKRFLDLYRKPASVVDLIKEKNVQFVVWPSSSHVAAILLGKNWSEIYRNKMFQVLERAGEDK